jgi:DUF1009 family protein
MSVADTTAPLGIIAGSKALPLILARQARSSGVTRIVAVGFEGETDPEIAKVVDEVVWLRVGQLNKLISAFTERGVARCVMAGQIAPNSLFDLRPDLRAMGMLLRLKEKNAHTIFAAIGHELRKDGVDLIEATPWLVPLMPKSGFRIGRDPTEAERSDISFGAGIAKEISRLEIGQIVVVKEGTVLAVEGFEGTDACLARGGKLAGKNGGAVAIKVAKEGHDMRFDIPCIGSKTIQTCAENGVTVLALEPQKTLVLEEEIVRELCRKHRISVVTTEPLEPAPPRAGAK